MNNDDGVERETGSHAAQTIKPTVPGARIVSCYGAEAPGIHDKGEIDAEDVVCLLLVQQSIRHAISQESVEKEVEVDVHRDRIASAHSDSAICGLDDGGIEDMAWQDGRGRSIRQRAEEGCWKSLMLVLRNGVHCW